MGQSQKLDSAEAQTASKDNTQAGVAFMETQGRTSQDVQSYVRDLAQNNPKGYREQMDAIYNQVHSDAKSNPNLNGLLPQMDLADAATDPKGAAGDRANFSGKDAVAGVQTDANGHATEYSSTAGDNRSGMSMDDKGNTVAFNVNQNNDAVQISTSSANGDVNTFNHTDVNPASVKLDANGNVTMDRTDAQKQTIGSVSVKPGGEETTHLNQNNTTIVRDQAAGNITKYDADVPNQGHVSFDGQTWKGLPGTEGTSNAPDGKAQQPKDVQVAADGSVNYTLPDGIKGQTGEAKVSMQPDGTVKVAGKDSSTQTPNGTADQAKNGDEKHGDTTVKKDDKGNIKEYDNGNYTLSKHDDGDWYYHENGDGHDYVKVDGDSIKMDDKGKVTYNESGMFGKEDQTLGNGSTSWVDSATHAVESTVENVGLATEGLTEGVVNGTINEFNHFSKQATDALGLPDLQLSDIKMPNQAQLDNSWGGKVGNFIGELPSKIGTAVVDAVEGAVKTGINFDKMVMQDVSTLGTDLINDPSKLGKDFSDMGQQAEDFGKGFVDGFVVKPVNAVIGLGDQVANWATDSNDYKDSWKLGSFFTPEETKANAAANAGDLAGQIAFAVATSEVGGMAFGALSRSADAAAVTAETAETTAVATTETAAAATTETAAAATTETAAAATTETTVAATTETAAATTSETAVASTESAAAATTESAPTLAQQAVKLASNDALRGTSKDMLLQFVNDDNNNGNDSIIQRLENAALIGSVTRFGVPVFDKITPETKVALLDQSLDSGFDKGMTDKLKENLVGQIDNEQRPEGGAAA